MKNKRKSLFIKILVCIILLGILFLQPQVIANKASNIERIGKEEYTEEYKEWLELPEEERKNTLEPRKFDVEYETNYSTYLKGINNKIKVAELLMSSSGTTYNLKDYISQSVQVKDQQQTNMCWAFAGTATLESHLALKHYKSTNENIKYDFSERHMAYSTAKNSLLNNGNNLFAFNGSVSQGGNYYMVEQYLTTGNGAILDEDMPFENTEKSIDISAIQGKDVVTTLLDTTLFATDDQTTKEQLITQMKNYITNYGGIYAGIHGAAILSDYYNNETGAIYCNNKGDAPMNHAVLIIGWDDNFNKPTGENYVNKFNSNCTPESYGAWIIKNSWGESISESLSGLKQSLWNNSENALRQEGYNSPEEIPNELIIELLAESYGESKVSIDEANDDVILEIGNKGYMYVSYDDINVYSYLWGIENAKNSVDYDNLYQHDHLGGAGCDLTYPGGAGTPIYMANVFSRDTQKNEELTKISLYTNQEYTCKVYVNPNGGTLDANLKDNEVTLAKGDANNMINIKPGYHAIEFAEPITLTGNSFAVALEIINDIHTKRIALEYPEPGSPFENAVVNEGESFISLTDMSEWIDTTDLASVKCDGNVTIKAFTNNIVEEPAPDPEPEILELQEIKITEIPGKLTYYVGEDFDATGMVVKAVYCNSARQEERDVTNAINVTDGTNLQLGKTAVTISYTDGEVTKTTTQAIVVQERVVEEPEVTLEKIEVSELPEKLQYVKDVEILNLAGGIIKATYSDDNEKYVDMTSDEVTASGFDNTKLGTNTITLSYEEQTTTFDVEIVEAPQEPEEEPGDEQPEEKEPTLSEFDDSSALLTELNISNDKYTITLKVSGINRKDEESDYKYYWYLSGMLGEDNIQDEYWTEITADKITKQSDGTYSLEVKIDSRNLPNVAELMNSDNLYIYIKEVATLGDNVKNQIISKSIDIDIEVEDDTSDKIDDAIENENKDNTTADVEIPKAGINAKIIIFIIAIAIIAVFAYNRFKYFNI